MDPYICAKTFQFVCRIFGIIELRYLWDLLLIQHRKWKPKFSKEGDGQFVRIDFIKKFRHTLTSKNLL